MPFIFQAIAAVAAIVFSFAILVKVGLPMLVAGLLALIAGYFIWQWENAESDENDPAWLNWLSSAKDLKDISKYLHQIF